MSRISDYTPLGSADRRSSRLALIADLGAGALMAVLAFPFPIVRASVPVPVFVALIVVAIALGGWLYSALTALLWGRTPGMYLFDLGFQDGRPGLGAAVIWAATRSEPLSGLRVVSCEPA